jgi:hypothetical protein
MGTEYCEINFGPYLLVIDSKGVHLRHILVDYWTFGFRFFATPYK